jgi:hypothetical protein
MISKPIEVAVARSLRVGRLGNRTARLVSADRRGLLALRGTGGAAVEGGNGPCCAWGFSAGACLKGVPIMSAFARRILPPAVIILGMAVVAAWMMLLGYGLVTLVEAL